MRRLRAAGAVLAFGAALFGGFSLADGSGSAGDAVDPIARVLGTDDPATKQAILAAQASRQARYATLLGVCLERAGFEGAGEAATIAPASNPPTAITEDEERATYGYGVTTRPATAPPVDPLAAYAASMPAERQARFRAEMGRSGGCVEQADKAIYARLKEVSDAYDAAESRMYAELAADPEVKKAADAWRTCMGGRFADPPAVNNYLRAKADALSAGDAAAREALNREEMALAAKDTTCRQRLVDPVFERKLRDAKAAFVKDHADVLARLRAAMMER